MCIRKCGRELSPFQSRIHPRDQYLKSPGNRYLIRSFYVKISLLLHPARPTTHIQSIAGSLSVNPPFFCHQARLIRWSDSPPLYQTIFPLSPFLHSTTMARDDGELLDSWKVKRPTIHFYRRLGRSVRDSRFSPHLRIGNGLHCISRKKSQLGTHPRVLNTAIRAMINGSSGFELGLSCLILPEKRHRPITFFSTLFLED